MAFGDTALVVMTFDTEAEAGEVLMTIRDLSSAGAIHIDDSAVVTKDADGKVEVKNQLDSGVKTGAVAGGFLGLLLGAFFFPIGGLLLGAGGGALIGKWMDKGVDKGFVEDVSNSLKPGGSALFITADGIDPAALATALEPYKGTLFHTSLPEDFADSIKRALL